MANPPARRRRKARPEFLPIGEFSSGTLRPEDVVPGLLYLADTVRLSRADRSLVRALAAEFRAWEDRPERFPDYDPAEAWDELDNVLGSYAPPFATLGAHPGDGACFGVWPETEAASEEAARFRRGFEADVAPSRELADAAWRGEVVCGKERNGGGPGFALEVNDHGNATLWERVGTSRRPRWQEAWSVV